ncbi:bifunctional helix-turn-helix transcriptional regulator/GNAT family N-acetyltransferase [Entomohabitans teleogrylli]|uniref:bifunctional helix-turn-helix transcriptional regulator/GNAT family N-acetyltransferase n=1 Tax=Entomohabitans teleogrylli TaxID=1384589 RepID=UPI00073D9B43|nr:bifunctional helix-turn-helix transcriptional regulator/GNAT family N-acetyltransferase [Entomohabitans teleogrylli]
MTNSSTLIEDIRSASRLMVRELGFMNATLAATGYSASAVHALLEIDAHGPLSAAQLVQLLGLEKSSISRLLGKLVEAGELVESTVDGDGRIKSLGLTAQGRHSVQEIHAYGRMQVETAMRQLNPTQQQTVAQGIALYAQALKSRRQAPDSRTAASPIAIESGYRPGLVGRVVEMHADFYSRYSGFGQFFESQVASGIAEFVGRLDNPGNRIWAALLNGRIVGSVAIDGGDADNDEAHLRWFILDDGCRGGGVGKRLLEQAVAFCDESGFPATHLWTFSGLNAARHLYEAHGFVLTHEAEGNQWGSVVTEQQFTRRKP